MYAIRVTDIVGGYTYKVLEPYDQDTYPVVSATLDEAVNAAMTLTFTIPSSHPNLADIKAAETTGGILVEAYRDGTQIFNGRVYKRTVDKMTGMHTFICESMFSRLNDSIVKPYHFAGTPAAYFQALFDNASMGSYVGTVTVTDPNNYIVRSNEEPSVLWDEIADKCIGSNLGGFIECDANGSQFSWLATPSASGTQKIRVAHNLLSCEDDFDVSERFTGVYVYGAELGTENEYGQKQYLDFNGVDISSSLPSGFTQLYNSSVIWKDSLVSQFGMIYKLAHFENVTTQSALISRAVSMLNNQSNITELRISAIDMSDIDGETDAITAGQTVEIVAPDGTISAMCTQISRDLLDPASTTFAFGAPDNISSSGSGSGAGGNSSISSPNFWHTEVTTSGTAHDVTGFSTLPLEDVLSDVEGRVAEIDGGAVWLNEIPTNHSGFEVRANQLNARIVSSSMATYENSLIMTGLSATLAGKNAGSTNAAVQVDGYNSAVNVTGDLSVTGTITSPVSTAVTNISDVLTQTSAQAANWPITAVRYQTWGKVAALSIQVTPTAAKSENYTNSAGTLVSGKRPCVQAGGAGTYTRGGITTGGSIALCAAQAMAANTAYTISFTYLLA
ncbi:MAG: hypothetical protein IKB96_02920 [Prevotella sp.]|nr:hypothetical protein [Prevotella sp.]